MKPDFYMKTFNAKNYWSAGPQERHDSVWEETPQETMAFMQEVEAELVIDGASLTVSVKFCSGARTTTGRMPGR